MGNLAIKGHATRGREVIELLEMLGGEDIYQINAYIENHVYFIDKDKIITWIKINQVLPEEFTVFTLEDFLKKFPYKVKDKVIVLSSNKEVYITNMEWRNSEIIYETLYNDECYECFIAKDLQPYKEETMKTHKTQKEVNIYLQDITIKNAQNLLDIEQHLNNDGLELPNNIVINKKGIDVFEFIKWYNKPQAPKTYVECAKILNCFGAAHIDGYKCELLEKFQELLICRDAYWKIAGEQMGLGKPWEPDWTDNSDKYFICYLKDEIWMSNIRDCNRLLVFPTEEMRDAFYENFKELIEECKKIFKL